MSSRVAVVSAAARTALGDDLDSTWEALLAGQCAVGPVGGFDASGFGSPFAAQIWHGPAVPEDDPALRILGRHGRLLEQVVLAAHDHGRADGLPRERIGLYAGIGMVDCPVDDLAPAVVAARDGTGSLDLETFFQGAYRQVHPLWPLAMLNNVAAGQVSIDLDLRGDNVVVSSEADGGVRALLEGAWATAEGLVDGALVGGVGEPLSPQHLARLRLRGGLGEGPARPGHEAGSGASPGEAAAAFLLQREVALGTVWPCAFLCAGATAFGRAAEHPGPAAATLVRAIGQALARAGLRGTDVDAVFLHGEGLASLDSAELEALDATLPHEVPAVATKGAVGHAGIAAPLLDVALATRALARGVLPPTCTAGPLLPEAARRLASLDAPVERTLRRVLVLAASAQGGAGALLLEAAH